MRRILPLVLLGLLLLPPAIARGEEEDVSASFPAPSKEKGFAWELNAMMGGKAIGWLKVAAEPTSDGASWHLTQSAELGGGAMKTSTDAVVDAALRAQSGEETEDDGEARTAKFQRSDEGFRVELKVGTGEPATVTVPAPGGASIAIVSAFLFCRMLPAEPATYARKVLDPTDKDREFLQDATVEVKGPGPWEYEGKTVEAWIATVRTGSKTWHAAFDPATRDVVGVRIEGTPVVFVPGAPIPVATIDFTKPAQSAGRAALRAGFAFAVGDAEILGDVTHWDSAFRAATGKAEAPAEEVAEFKRIVLGGLEAHAPRAQMQASLPPFEERLQTEEQPDGSTLVTFPPEMRGLTLLVREFEGVWKLVKLPQKP